MIQVVRLCCIFRYTTLITFQTTYEHGLNLIWESKRCIATHNVIPAHNEIRNVIKPHFNVYDVIKN